MNNMKTITIKFKGWNGVDTVTFTNDGQFTRNSLTDTVVPQNQEQFEHCINNYLSNENAQIVND